VPDTIFESQPLPKLLELIRESFGTIAIIPIQRRHFNDKQGIEQISKLCSRKSGNILQIIARKYYCISAAAALLGYLKNVCYVNFADHCLKVDYQTKGGVMIDTQTSVKLELLYSLKMDAVSAKKLSLYGLLNRCETKIGQRHLRANILEPSCDIDFIEKRHDQIKILLENTELLDNLRENLKNFRNAESLLKISCITQAADVQKSIESSIQLALLLKNCLESIKPLAQVVAESYSDSFEAYRILLSTPIFNDIIETINKVVQANIHENRLAKKHFLHLYCVKAGNNETIDTLRQLYVENVEKIREFIEKLTESSVIPLKMIYTTKLGYHLIWKNATSTKVPSNYELIYRKGTNAYLTTPELIAMNDKVQLIEKNLLCISSAVLRDMLLEIAKEIDVIYHLIGVIIDLDIIQSLALISGQESYCCPTFNRVLRLEDAYHPMLTMCYDHAEIIKNNVIATPQYNFYTIFGPNMSGKSIYIKMIAVIQIMAQIGCFVPAKSATMKMCDKIFSRLGFQDNIEQSASSFTVELRDMEYIYSNLTPNSLLIIDELCRSTDPQEGEVLCYAFCEKLLNFIGVSRDEYFKTKMQDEGVHDDDAKSTERSKNLSTSLIIKGADIKLKDITRPFIFLTTHFSELAKLVDKFNNAIK
jgi:DNA mismatch repair protein MSH4